MHTLQNVKFVNAISPAVIKDNAAYTAGVVDTLGWSYASIVLQFGATDIAMAALSLNESDDNSSFTAVAGCDFATNTNLNIDGAALALPDANMDNKIYAVHLDMSKHKRYLQVVATAGDGSAGTYLSGLAILSRGQILPTTSAGQGCQAVVRA